MKILRLLCFFCILSISNTKSLSELMNGINNAHIYTEQLNEISLSVSIFLEYLIELNNLRPTLFMAVHKTQNLEETKLFDANIEAFTREFILFNNLIVDLVLPTRNYLINLIVKSFDILEKF